MEKEIKRRDLFKLGVATAAVLAVGKGLGSSALAGTVNLAAGGKDFSPKTGSERKMVPSACWSCVTRDSMIGFVEDGRLVKLEGHPDSIRGKGKICSKGAAGINQLYDPDRILYPMKRAGKRGEGKWKRVSWDEALTELAGRLKKLRDEGHPEKFMFHYGRMKASSSKIVKSVFLATYGTGTIGNHTSICEGGKWVGQELTWGKHYDNWDFDHTKLVVNFGSGVLDAHTNHIPTAQRLVTAMVDRGVKMYTFDPRLGNTAARSTEWLPLKPGTDRAVVLAMCREIMNAGLYDRDFFKFIKATENRKATKEEKAAALKKHLEKFTPEWAEKISGVPAAKIKSIALEIGKTKPTCVISYRGAVAHYDGADTERAVQMLAAITGNIDNPGGRCRAVHAHWKYPKGPKKPKAKKLKILDGFPGEIAFPNHHANHQVLKMIKDGRAGRPEIYMWYCYTPVYSHGETQENIDILKDEKLIPYTVCVSPYYDESGSLADLILPNPSYLEWWDWEDNVSPTQVAEYYIRQPFVKPLGECRDFKDVVCELAERMGFPLGFKTAEEFVKLSCEMTPGVKEAGGFEYMKKHGVWHDAKAKPKYFMYKREIKPEALKKDGVILDEATGVYWNWKKVHVKSEEEAKKKGYLHTKSAYKGYVGQEIDGKVYAGFKPDKVNKSGYFELYSELMKIKKLSPLPTYRPIPALEKMGPDDLVLTSYKVPVHIHSRSANCKWLTEICHRNPAMINPVDAEPRGIKSGDKIKVKSAIAEITTTANVTEAIVPGAIAISHSLGHWQYGRYASGKKAPMAGDNDPDLKVKWWNEYGVHPNWVMANKPDPISGQWAMLDNPVTLTKV